MNLYRSFLLIIFLLVFKSALYSQENIDRNYVSEDVFLELKEGSLLDGTLLLPKNSNGKIPLAIIVAGSGPTDQDGNNPIMKNNSLKYLAECLSESGIATLRYNKRGISKSTNLKMDSVVIEDYVHDTQNWIKKYAKDPRFSGITLIGHSEGSLICIIASEDNKNVSKLISLSGAGYNIGDVIQNQIKNQLKNTSDKETSIVMSQVDSYLDQLKKSEFIKDTIPPYLNSLFAPSLQPYLMSWLKYDPQAEIAKLKIPILLIQGTTDVQISIDNIDALNTGCKNCEKIIIENVNHILKDCSSLDINTQLKETYQDPDKPISRELCNYIENFISK